MHTNPTVLHNLQSDIGAIVLAADSLCLNHTQGFCAVTYQGQVCFWLQLGFLHTYKNSVVEPAITQNIIAIEDCLGKVTILNQRIVNAVAGYLGFPIPLNKNMAKRLQRAVAKRAKREQGSYFLWGRHEESLPLHRAICDEAINNRGTLLNLHTSMNMHIDEILLSNGC